METNYMILRKHLLVNADIVVKENVTKQELVQFIQRTSARDIGQYRFIKGEFIKPEITYSAESIEEEVEEVKNGNIAQRIFAKYTQGSLFDEKNCKGTI